MFINDIPVHRTSSHTTICFILWMQIALGVHLLDPPAIGQSESNMEKCGQGSLPL